MSYPKSIIPGTNQNNVTIAESDAASIKIAPDSLSGSDDSNTEAKAAFRRTAVRRGRTFHPIIMILTLIFLCLTSTLLGEFYGSVDLGVRYTDNAFQLSEYDLNRYEYDLEFVHQSDDVVLNTLLFAAYQTHWRWWKIQPFAQSNMSQNLLNPAKQRFDIMGGIKVIRKLGEAGVYYGYYPDIYIRDYNDSDGTNEMEKFSYDKNLYRADLKVRPLKNSTVSLDYRLEKLYYNEYFTEFDGDIDTWTLGWQQSFPTFYIDASYGFKQYQTDKQNTLDNPEDASYESNIYAFGILLKKMPLDDRYPYVQWRPELDLRFEERYFQGSDSWHAGRKDNINTTTGALHFYLGETWNLKLDYSHIFRNVEAAYSSVRKYKEYSENRFGITARYKF